MPARLHFSNSLDILADRLIENLAVSGGNIFEAPALATPGAAMRDWLKVRIAEKTGIAANIAFPHLENLLWDRLAERDRFRDVEDRQPARLLDSFSFQGLVLAQLRRDPPSALRGYLQTGSSAEDARRLCQLSGRLAALFREYEYSRVAEGGRPGLAESWMRGERCFDRFAMHPDVPELEGWQMKIYEALFRPADGLRDRWGEVTKTYRYTLPQYAEMVLGAGSPRIDAAPETRAAKVFHLFGLSNISPFHRDLIGRLADARENALGDRAASFEIYALNPCAEFWEDALTPRERQARASRRKPGRVDPRRIEAAKPDPIDIEQGEIPEAAQENGLLALFGKPGRETIKLWCQLTGHDFNEDFRGPTDDSLLHTVQKSVLSRLGKLEPPESAEPEMFADAIVTKVPLDPSLRIRSAPDPRTEMEAVRAEAAALLRDHPDLRPEDLAIIPADPGKSLPLIRAVFAGGREAAGNVPVLLPEADLASDSPLLRGFQSLLAPSTLAADRNAVLALLENPAIARKAGIDAERLRAIREFWEAAGFQEGWGDAEFDPGLSTARAAEERAVLARVLDARDDAVAASGFWPAQGATGRLEREEVAGLVVWLADLREALRPFREGTARAYSEWAGFLRKLLDRFLQPEEEDASDRRADLDLRRFFAEMEQWDQWGDEGEGVTAELVTTLLEDAFRDPGSPRSSFLRGGVRVGGLAALRGIPFRHVWVTGLAAGTFPASGEAAPLDLRGYRRLPGENDPASRDLYALLEVIASTAESLTLSWTRRDAARDAEVSPSRALTGLKAWLDSDVLIAGSELRFEALRAAKLPIPPRNVSNASYPLLWAEAPKPERARIEWPHVAEYLGNPAVHAAKVHLGLKPYDALDFSEEERAAGLFYDGRADAALLDSVLRAELVRPGSAPETFDRIWAERARGGLLPPPPYDTMEHDRLRAEVTGFLMPEAEHLRLLLAEKNLKFAGSLRIGPQDARGAEPPVISIPVFDASSIGVAVEVGGILPWFFHSPEPGGGWALRVEDGGETPAYLLDLCVSALDAHELLRGPGHILLRHKKADSPGKVHTIHPLPERDADHDRHTLRDLLADIATAPSFDDIPLAGIEKIREQTPEGETVEDWVEAIESWWREEEDKIFGGLKFWDRVLGTIQAAVPGNTGEIVARRILPYLRWKRAWYPAKRKNHGAAEDAA